MACFGCGSFWLKTPARCQEIKWVPWHSEITHCNKNATGGAVEGQACVRVCFNACSVPSSASARRRRADFGDILLDSAQRQMGPVVTVFPAPRQYSRMHLAEPVPSVPLPSSLHLCHIQIFYPGNGRGWASVMKTQGLNCFAKHAILK